MFVWIQANLATLVISVFLIVLVASILVHMVRAKKQGKSSCGCDRCGCCAGCGAGSCAETAK